MSMNKASSFVQMLIWASTGVVVFINHLNSWNSLRSFLRMSSSWQMDF